VHTRNIGLVATVNTNFSHPYNAARMLASLDHISGGRAGWNIVSSFNEATARNFGMFQPGTLGGFLAPAATTPLGEAELRQRVEARGHAERYERAAEFVDLAKAYWDSYEDDAFDKPDAAGGQFYDPDDAHPVDVRGKYFSAEGLLDMARPIQGYPVFVQAGNSETGRDFAAQVAEMTYCSAQTLDDARAYYKDVKSRMAKFGRDPDQLKITPGLSVVVGETDQQAADRFGELQALIDFSKGVTLGAADLTGYDLDGPLPDLPETDNGKGRFRQLVALARSENLTIRQLVYRFGTSRGHLQIHGSPTTVADKIEEWHHPARQPGPGPPRQRPRRFTRDGRRRRLRDEAPGQEGRQERVLIEFCASLAEGRFAGEVRNG
jgi:alkanesulfonate monooxygenase SsuD/methylene tetrahydromethanopterin reductase-like flavin-dependent oxidoreductase (luciferase family)